MCKKVIKRDGRVVEFDHSRIFAAIESAFKASGLETNYAFICRVATKISEDNKEILHVEEVQDLIVQELKSKFPEVANLYKEYRHKRDLVRKSKRYKVFNDIVEVKQSEVAVENGNMNADTPSGMIYKFASEISKEFSLDVLIEKEFVEAHTQGIIHIHDLDYYATRSLTCLQHPLDKILSEGFSAGHGESRPSRRIETASILGCISMEAVQNEMHGGQAIPAFDFYLAPYVRRTYQEEIDKIADLLGKSLTHLYDVEIKDYIKEPLNNHKGVRMTDKRIIQKAINNTVDRVHQSMEAFIHNMNTIHSRGGNQVVFSSINYGTDTSAEGRCIIREILNSTYKGVGNGKTAIFPIQIWKSKSGVSYKPEDPNYDLYKLACKVTAKRFFPNFLNLDATFNTHESWNINDPNRYNFEPSTMGCFCKDTSIIMADGTRKPVQDVVVGDFIMGDDGTPRKVLSLVRGRSSMYRVDQKHAETYVVNQNHILSLKWTSVKEVNGWKKGDVVNITVEKFLELPYNVRRLLKGYKAGYELPEKEYAIPPYVLGLWLGDGVRDRTTFCVNKSETRIYDDLCEYADSNGMYINRYDRGSYFECTINSDSHKNKLLDGLREYSLLKNKHIPDCYLLGSCKQRSELLAGLINTDGWSRTGRGRNTVCFGNTNYDLCVKTKMLADSLGYSTNIYKARESKVGKANGVDCNLKDYWHVSIRGFDNELLMDNKRTSLSAKRDFCNSELLIEKLPEDDFFGFELDGNQLHQFNDGTVTHNCRTRVFENRFGLKTSIGRGNISFTTLNLPRVALEIIKSGCPVEDYKKCLKSKVLERVEFVARQLDSRYQFQAKALKKQFPLLMSGLWTGSAVLDSEDSIESVLNQGTLGIGFIGLAECLVALFGKHHGESEEVQEIGLDLVKSMANKASELSVKYKHNYSILATPAEGLSGRFTRIDRERFGVIKGVTDREFYTNSNHVPVYYKCTAVHKAEVECPYHQYTLGGHIFYVEQDGDPTHNPQAIMTIVDMLHYYNGGYTSINYNQNVCYHCGHFWNGKESKCPRCSSTDIDTLQRITGYLVGSTKRWNKGKLCELKERTSHQINQNNAGL